MYKAITTENLIKELLISIFDQNTDNSEFQAIYQEVKRRLSK